MLSEVTASELWVDESVPIDLINLTHHCFDQCRLACAVWADKGDPGLHVDVDVDFFQQDLFVVPTDLALVEPQNWRRNLVWVGKDENAGGIFDYFVNQLYLIDGLDSRLRHRSSFRVEPKFVYELLIVRNSSQLRVALP